MRQCEYKKKYDQNRGAHIYEHIHGGSILSPLKYVVRSILGKTTKNLTKKAIKDIAKKTATTAVSKSGTHLGNMAGDKIIRLLRGQSTPAITKKTYNKPQTSQSEIDERVNQLLGSGIRRKKIVRI